MVLTSLDLTPLGVPHKIRAGFRFNTIKHTDLRKGKRIIGSDGKTRSFILGDDDREYKVLEELGEGTYGIAYKTEADDGKTYAIKYIKGKLTEEKDFHAFLKECVIQTLVVEYSKDQTNGPFAPRVYDICYDHDEEEGIVRSELMINTLDNLVGSLNAAQNNAVVPDALRQIARIMTFLQKELRFNHRDMKGDNIMYARSDDGRSRAMKLIDFGMSCVTWQGMQLSGSTWFDEKHSCFKVDRDMTQLVYYIQRYQGTKLHPVLLARLQRLVLANVGAGHKCAMDKLCPAHGLSEWKHVYDFVDRANVKIPTGTPEFVAANMDRFLKREPFISPSPEPVPIPAAPPVKEPKGICPPGTKRNPKTGRCVKDKAGAPLVGAPGAGAAAAPVAAKPVWKPAGKPAAAAAAAAAAAGAAAAAPCPPGKVLNPKTRRCIKADGAVAKRVTKKARREF